MNISHPPKNTENKYKLIISGCVAQAEGEEIKSRAPSVDYIVGPQSYHKLPSMIEENNDFINDEFLQSEKFTKLIFKTSNILNFFRFQK